MNHTSDTATAENGGNFDPHQAAALLDQTTQQARRQLAPSPPWLLATRAVAVLGVCGAVWLNVRGQDPYQGPTASVIPVLIAFIVLNFGATVGVRERALAGVRGTTRLRPAEITVMVLAWAAVPVFMLGAGRRRGELRPVPHHGADRPRPGLGGRLAARAGWRKCGIGLAVAAVGVVGAFAGPAGAWAVAGVGLCAVLAGQGRRRRLAAARMTVLP